MSDLDYLFSPKQWQFITQSNAKWNIAHGSVRAGKTVCSLFAFMLRVEQCEDSQIGMVGYTTETIYRNAVRLIMEAPEFSIFRPFCTWSNRRLHYKNKIITTFGASNEGAIGSIQGQTFSLVYCDEITLFPNSIIEMIDSRLSKSYSMGYATCNPSHPDHIVKKWVDCALAGDKNYYQMSFRMEDNPFLPPEYIDRIKSSSSGLFRKRNIEGVWCLAEGSIFECFDTRIHVLQRPPRAAEYWIAGIDFGMVNPFACVLVGVSTGKYTQTGKCLWVEDEYYWDPSPGKKGRQKTVGEYVEDIIQFIQPYGVRQIYIDPSAEALQVEFSRKGIRVMHANNDVENGIQTVAAELQKGNLFILDDCNNLIREIQGYVWDPKAAKKGLDSPLKQNDHAVDALRYAIASHKVPTFYGNEENFGRTLGYKKP